jgi:hypothetical protein
MSTTREPLDLKHADLRLRLIEAHMKKKTPYTPLSIEQEMVKALTREIKLLYQWLDQRDAEIKRLSQHSRQEESNKSAICLH